MNMKHLISRQTLTNLSKLNATRSISTFHYPHRNFLFTAAPNALDDSFIFNPDPKTPNARNCTLNSNRLFHSTQLKSQLSNAATDAVNEEEEEDDGIMNEFLSRFVFKMRGKLNEAYPDCDKATVGGMLLVIVDKVVEEMEKEGGLERMLSESNSKVMSGGDLSEDLWKTVWEESNKVLEDMEKERKKEKMKGFLQCEEVKEMCRFAGEVGIRGDLLKELRFKWAKEKMEESEFYEGLERLHKEAEQEEEGVSTSEQKEKHRKVVVLPKRHGKIRYKIYGLDLSGSKWSEVADRIHGAEELIWPQEPKPVSGKCKLVMDKILSLNAEDDPAPLLAEWVELLEPSRVDWISLLNQLQQRNSDLYLKVAELLLDEKSFQTGVGDYSKLIDAHAKKNCVEGAERILKKMNENGILPDILTATALVHMYSKAGNLDRAKEAFESLRNSGFRPDKKVYNSMIMAYVNAGQPRLGEALMREMEARDIKPSPDIYMALLRAFAQRGDDSGAGRIATTMQFAGFQPSLEFCTLLVEAYGQAGDPDQARSNFDYMIKVGHKPDDRCTASMIAAYEKKNSLDKALDLLLQLKKDGFEPGPATYTVLVDWLSKLQLVNEAEHLLGKIADQGEAPGLKIHVSLCDMYSRAKLEKKALQALGVLESKADQLGPIEFERIISGLMEGGFLQDARRIQGLMEAQGFAVSDKLKVALMGASTFKRPSMR